MFLREEKLDDALRNPNTNTDVEIDEHNGIVLWIQNI